MAVPCCQHELNATIPESILPGLTEYGIFRDRFAAMATDALRARLLDVHGYRTQVLEFIELEHTPKNVLLRAVRRPAVSEDESAVRRQAYDRLKADLGIQTWRLEAALSN
jgi:hypothetical protein